MDEDQALEKLRLAFIKWKDLGNREEAINDVKSICELHVGEFARGQAYGFLGDLCRESGLLPEAKENLLQAVHMSSSEFSRFQNTYDVAEICILQNDLKEAVHWLLECIEVVLRDPAIYVGQVYRLLSSQNKSDSRFAEVWDRLSLAIQLNWEYLIPEESFPNNIDRCIIRLDKEEERRRRK